MDASQDIPVVDARDRTERSPAALMDVWTIYRHPSDYPPGTWVARRSEVMKGATAVTGDVRVAESREALEALLPPGLHPLPRMVGEDPVIVGHFI